VQLDVAPSSISLREKVSGVWTVLGTNSALSTTQNAWYDLRIKFKGARIEVWRGLRGGAMELVLDNSDTDVTGSTIRHLVWVAPSATYRFDDIRLEGLGVANTATTFAYNTANELTAMTKNGVATAITYDAWGRTVTKARDGENTVYAYLYGGRLSNVSAPGGSVAYDYNGAGQRVSRTWSNDEIQRNSYWNGWSVVNEYLDDDNATYYDWERSYVGGLAERAYYGGATAEEVRLVYNTAGQIQSKIEASSDSWYYTYYKH
jgi:YD repeat-containing protein